MTTQINAALGLSVTAFNRSADEAKRKLKEIDTAADKAGAGGLGRAQKSLSGIANSLRTAGGFLGTAAGVGGIYTATRALTFAYRTGLDAAESQEQFELALRNSGQAAGNAGAEFAKYAEGMESALQVSDESLKRAAASAAVNGQTLAQFRQNVPALLDIAARFFGGDIEKAQETVNAAMLGRVRGITSMGIAFEKTGDKVKDSENALKALAKASAGAHDEMMKRNPALAMKRMIDNMQEEFSKPIYKELTKQMQETGTAAVNQQASQIAASFGQAGAAGLSGYANSVVGLSDAMGGGDGSNIPFKTSDPLTVQRGIAKYGGAAQYAAAQANARQALMSGQYVSPEAMREFGFSTEDIQRARMNKLGPVASRSQAQRMAESRAFISGAPSAGSAANTAPNFTVNPAMITADDQEEDAAEKRKSALAKESRRGGGGTKVVVVSNTNRSAQSYVGL